MDSRKAFYLALIALDWIFWLASLVVYFVNVEDSGCSGIILIIGIILNTFCLVLDPIIFSSLEGHMDLDGYGCEFLPGLPLAYQPGFVCISAILLIFEICDFVSMKYGIWFLFVSKLIKLTPHLCVIHVLNQDRARARARPTQVPQLSQPRPNLLANQPPTALTPNFEDVEQPPPSYEECMAQRNDLPPKYEDLELPPPAYQETMV